MTQVYAKKTEEEGRKKETLVKLIDWGNGLIWTENMFKKPVHLLHVVSCLIKALRECCCYKFEHDCI